MGLRRGFDNRFSVNKSIQAARPEKRPEFSRGSGIEILVKGEGIIWGPLNFNPNPSPIFSHNVHLGPGFSLYVSVFVPFQRG